MKRLRACVDLSGVTTELPRSLRQMYRQTINPRVALGDSFVNTYGTSAPAHQPPRAAATMTPPSSTPVTTVTMPKISVPAIDPLNDPFSPEAMAAGMDAFLKKLKAESDVKAAGIAAPVAPTLPVKVVAPVAVAKPVATRPTTTATTTKVVTPVVTAPVVLVPKPITSSVIKTPTQPATVIPAYDARVDIPDLPTTTAPATVATATKPTLPRNLVYAAIGAAALYFLFVRKD